MRWFPRPRADSAQLDHWSCVPLASPGPLYLLAGGDGAVEVGSFIIQLYGRWGGGGGGGGGFTEVKVYKLFNALDKVGRKLK